MRVLHLSDVHFRASKTWDINPVLRALTDFIGERVKAEEPPDLVAFTGDLAFSGQPAEYELAGAWLNELWPKLGNPPKDRLLLVPGNHDVDRTKIDIIAEATQERLLKKGLGGSKSQEQIGMVLGNDGQRDILLGRHAAYLAFAADWFGGPQPLPWWRRIIEIDGVRVHVAGLNSAWMASGDEDRGRLLLGRWQIHEFVVAAEAAQAHWRLALLHHPWDYLAEFDHEEAPALVQQHCDLVLRGHRHKTDSKSVARPDPNRCCIELAAGCVYEDSQYPNAFQWIELSPPPAKQVRVGFYLWHKGAWRLDKNHGDNGWWQLDLAPVELAPTPQRDAGSGKYLRDLLAGTAFETFADPKLPTPLIDQKIDDEVNILRKSRFFAEFDQVRASLALGRRLTTGELSGGTDAVRSLALAWCARLLSRTDELGKAEEYLKLAKLLGTTSAIDIADAFISSQKGEKNTALKALARTDSPSARSAAFMVVAHHEGVQGALDWLRKTQIEISQLDSDGKLFLLSNQLELAHWEGAEQTIKVLSDRDLAEAPLLHHVLAVTRLLSAVPIEFRGVVLNQFPFQAADFPLASDEAAIAARREAQRQFVDSANIARSLNCPRAAKLNDEYALWLELRDPQTSANGRQRLESRLRDPASALCLVPLALQFGIKLDLTAVEREIERQIALNGEITADTAVARFALAFTRKSPGDVASYIAQHYDALSKYLNPKAMRFLQTEMLSRAGLHEKANEQLDNLRKEGLSESEERRLRKIIAEAQGADPVELRKEQFKETGSLTDLIVLVDELEAKGAWDDLCEFGKILFERTRSVSDAERLAIALSNTQKTVEIVERFKGLRDLRGQSKQLQMCYCWALYHEGELLEARAKLASLAGERDQGTYRALVVNLGIMLGDWPSLSAFVADEYLARDKRSARELIEIAQLAHHLGSPRARDLTMAAAAKGHDDAGVLSSAYFLASNAGWNVDEEIAGWLHKAAELSGDDGPIKMMTLKELAERKPEWDRRESEAWRMVSRGETPMFLAGQALHRSLMNLMLFPAIANMSQRDPRRRGMIPAYCGTRQLSQSFEATTIGIDATALLTLSLLNVLNEALDTFDTVFIPHSTLAWLFEEKQKAAFHQPSRIRDAHQIRHLLATGRLEKLVPSSVADADLSAHVGDELALLIAEAEKPRDGDDRQRIVVRPSPVYRLGSLMHEEADLTEHASVVSSCLSIVAKLRLKGQLTAAEEKRARAYLQLSEKPWPQEPKIADSAILYLDCVAMSYFLHIGILEKLQEAGFTVIASPSEVANSDALITYEGISDKVNNAIERIRSALNVRIESGRIKVGARRRRPEADGDPIYEHPTVGTIALAAVCDAVICDDRFVNQHPYVVDDGVQALMLSTLDLLDALVARGSITAERCLECRTLLRRGGYVLVPVRDDELAQYLNASTVVDGKVIEAAELKAIRENLLCIRMSNWLQLPKEAPWLDSTLKSLVRVLKSLWEPGADPSTVIALSDWIVDLVDVRGWAHRFSSEAGDNLINIGRGAHILLLLSPPIDGSQDAKEPYWEWVEDRVLAPVKEQFSELYANIVEWEKAQIAAMADTDLTEVGRHEK